MSAGVSRRWRWISGSSSGTWNFGSSVTGSICAPGLISSGTLLPPLLHRSGSATFEYFYPQLTLTGRHTVTFLMYFPAIQFYHTGAEVISGPISGVNPGVNPGVTEEGLRFQIGRASCRE